MFVQGKIGLHNKYARNLHDAFGFYLKYNLVQQASVTYHKKQ